MLTLSILLQCDKSACNMTKKSPQSCSSSGSHHNCGDHNSNTTLASMESCRSCERTCDPRSLSSGPPLKPLTLSGSRCSDNGYSSCGDGCESCSMPSSNDGSDIACSEGVCTGIDGKLLFIDIQVMLSFSLYYIRGFL